MYLQWNVELTKRQRTREIGSLNRGSAPYILKGRAEQYHSFYRELLYRGSLNRGSTVTLERISLLTLMKIF